MTTLTQQQRQQAIESAHALIDQAALHFQRSFSKPTIRFTLEGQRAGLYVWRRNDACCIDFNTAVFAADFDHHLKDTVAHEVAHHVTHQLFGHKVKPHGKEWKRVAQLLGAQPRAQGDYSLEGVKVRRQQRFDYQCKCSTWLITTTRHNRIQKGAVYRCRKCGDDLKLVTVT